MSTDFILLTAGDIRHGQFPLPLTLLCHQQDIRLDQVCNGSSEDDCSPGEQVDHFAVDADLEYSFYLYLKRFLERFAPDTGVVGQTFLPVLYDTHPNSAFRIQQLNSIDEQRMLPGV